jgi:methylase of polypeptide subunit release factors
MPDIPVRFPSQEVFDRVRAFFQGAGFDDAHFNHMMGELKRTSAVPKPGDLVASTEPCESMLIRLFLGGRVRENDFLRLAGEAVLRDLRELGLIVNESPGILASTVRVRPFLDLYVLSDHFIEGNDFADDFVHAPDDANTLNYLKYISLRPCDHFLEACGGSGIAALIAAKRCAKQAWSSDIAERSSTFARFGAALSGLGNFTAVTGDTYEPVEHLSFDRIAVHPPYIPVLRHSYIFHGGGVDGEQITRKHIADLHGRLKPGGRLYCRCAGTDRKGEALEQRVRKWLGEHQGEYDIAMQVLGYIDPWRFLTKSVRSGRTKPEELKQWEKVFEEMGLEKLVMSVFVVQRHDSPREPFTVRREEGPFSGPRELEWLLDMETERARRGVEMVLSSRLTINPMAVLNIMHVPREGDWQMRNQLVEVLHPHPMKFELDPLSAYLLPKLRGRMTGRELFASLMEEGLIAPDNVEEGVLNFGAGLSNLASGGFLFVEGFEPPAPARREEPES